MNLREATNEQLKARLCAALKHSKGCSCGECSQGLNTVDEMLARLERIETALRDACDVAVWMSGSDDFSPSGKAHDGWVNEMRPKLYAALAVLAGDAQPAATARTCAADEDGSWPCDPSPNDDGTATCTACGWRGRWPAATDECGAQPAATCDCGDPWCRTCGEGNLHAASGPRT